VVAKFLHGDNSINTDKMHCSGMNHAHAVILVKHTSSKVKQHPQKKILPLKVTMQSHINWLHILMHYVPILSNRIKCPINKSEQTNFTLLLRTMIWDLVILRKVWDMFNDDTCNIIHKNVLLS
jgi:hypothetical protein